MRFNFKCPVCGKEIKNPSFKQVAEEFVKTIVYGSFKMKDPILNDYITVDCKRALVCSEGCKQKNENQYFVEEYKGNKIYCVNGRWMPYFDCSYYYDSVEGVKNRIDHANQIPVTPLLINSLTSIAHGGDI